MADICSHSRADQRTFTLLLPDQYLARVESLQRRAGLYDGWDVIKDLQNDSHELLKGTALDAMLSVHDPIVDSENITACGFYDPVDRQWKFASIVG